MKKGQEKPSSSKAARSKPLLFRYYFIVTLVLLASLTVIGRLTYLQVINRHFLQNQGNQRSVRFLEIPAHRGIIFDRHGQPLAISTPVTSLWANPGELVTAKNRWSELASLLDMSPFALKRKIEKNSQLNFLYLKRQLPPTTAETILKKKFPGVYGIREYRRYYPAGSITSQLIGMTNIDNTGQSGLEMTYDSWLSGNPGKERIVRDLYGHAIEKATIVKSASPGKPLYLSIDLRLQYLAYRALEEAINRHQASSGTIVMLDPQTGEVLSIVNYPSFNPNNRSDYVPEAARNRAITDQYEPGSTIKAFTVAAALQSGLFTPDTPIDTSPGWMMANGYTIKDDKNFGLLDVTGVIRKSSNIGVSKMAFAIGQQALLTMLRHFGFGQSTGIAFPGESLGYVPFSRKLSKAGLSNLSFGYHISVTPLQLARAYSSLASNGILRPVSLLKLDHESTGTRAIPENISRQIMTMLETVVNQGTGKKAAVTGYSVAGKTGTSHKAGNEGYEENSYFSSFIGAIPATKPRIVTLIMLNNVKKGSYFGGSAAGPVFSKLGRESMRILGVPPDQ